MVCRQLGKGMEQKQSNKKANERSAPWKTTRQQKRAYKSKSSLGVSRRFYGCGSRDFEEFAKVTRGVNLIIVHLGKSISWNLRNLE